MYCSYCTNCIQNKLLTVSSDQTLRVWDLKGSNFSNPQILYDHEEEIMAVATCGTLFASMDTEGNVLVRDVKNHSELLCQAKVYKQYETGCLLFKGPSELFVFCNNEVELIDMSGHVLQRMEFDQNVVCATQDDDTIIVAY